MTRLSIGPVMWSYTLCFARILMDRLPRAQSKPVIRMPSSSARNGATEASPLVAKARSLDVPASTASDGKRKTRPPILPTAKSMPMPIALTPRTQYAKQVRLMATVMISVVTSTANNIYFKRTVDAFKSKDPNHPHDYEFFVSQATTLLYICLPLSIILRKRWRKGDDWWQGQHVPWQTFAIVGLMDCLTALSCVIGGAYTGGGIQNLLDQLMLPITLLFSATLLGEVFNNSQYIGSLIIIVGTIVALLPTFSGDDMGTTMLGVVIYGFSNFPAAFSSIYKEYAIKTLANVDLYYLATGVSMMQAVFGFVLMPLMAFPAFGGIPLNEVPLQMYQGWQCFRGINSQPGDDCRTAPAAMLNFVLWSFLYDISMLLITKEGSAALMVVSSALSLPVTNIAFTYKWIAGDSADPFNSCDVLALILVSLGFSVYSAADIFASPAIMPDGSTRGPPPSSRVRRTFRMLPHRIHKTTDESLAFYARGLSSAPDAGKVSGYTVQFSDAFGRTDSDDLASSI